MVPQTLPSSPFYLPRIRETFRLPSEETKNESPPETYIFYDVKFYPYHSLSSQVAPVFAVVGGAAVLICRPSVEKGTSVSVLKALQHVEILPKTDHVALNSCEWNFVQPSQPLLSVGGFTGNIQVLDALTGQLVTTLVGHGGEVNDLSTHPIYPWILASASADHSVRIWDLRPKKENGENACLIICGHGQAHKEGILTISWHASGRYLISGGHDHIICVWTIPDLSPTSRFFDELKPSKTRRSSQETHVIHFPHFISQVVHSNFVDCAKFYGDLILSKAAEENKIVLWRVTNFNSKRPPPGLDQAPKTGEFKDTRNGFMPQLPPQTQALASNGTSHNEEESNTEPPPPFQRLLEFSIPSSQPFYQRFDLLCPTAQHPDLHHVLAFGNTNSKIMLWDLTRLELGQDGSIQSSAGRRPSSHQPTSNSIIDPVFRRPSGRGRLPNLITLTRRQNRNTPIGASEVPSVPNSSPPSTPSSRRSSSIHTDARASSTTATSTSFPPPALPLAHPPTAITGPIFTATAAPRPDRRRFPIPSPFEPLKAHESRTVVGVYFTARQCAWSPCGRWCVVVGESGHDALGVVLERWV